MITMLIFLKNSDNKCKNNISDIHCSNIRNSRTNISNLNNNPNFSNNFSCISNNSFSSSTNNNDESNNNNNNNNNNKSNNDNVNSNNNDDIISDKHFVKSVRIRSFPGPYFAAFGLKMMMNCFCGMTDQRKTF